MINSKRVSCLHTPTLHSWGWHLRAVLLAREVNCKHMPLGVHSSEKRKVSRAWPHPRHISRRTTLLACWRPTEQAHVIRHQSRAPTALIACQTMTLGPLLHCQAQTERCRPPSSLSALKTHGRSRIRLLVSADDCPYTRSWAVAPSEPCSDPVGVSACFESFIVRCYSRRPLATALAQQKLGKSPLTPPPEAAAEW